MKLLDRMLLRSFFSAWIACFVSLVSLYLVIDLFTKLDDFVEAAGKTGRGVFSIAVQFYAYQLVLIFDRLCGIIVLMAAMFTIAWMQRNNEILPLLSAGVPTRRILRPVLLGSVVMIFGSLINREVIMPRFADRLMEPASDPDKRELTQVYASYEPNGILISGQAAMKLEQKVINFSCTIPERIAGGLLHITAREARYVPPGTNRLSGGWLLIETTPPELPAPLREARLEMLVHGRFFLFTERVDFDHLTRNRKWYQYASALEIFHALQQPETARLAALAVQLHLRLTLPLLTLLMVFLGMSLILRDQCRNVYLNAGLALAMAGLFYGSCYTAAYLGEREYLSAAMAAWLPVLIFGPIGVAAYDGIHT